MSQNHRFTFISHNGREGKAPLDIVYPRILKNFDISIVSSLKYLLQSSVSDEVFDSFINFLNLESIPEINTRNVTEFLSLSQELKFRELEMLVEKFIKEKKECDEIIQQLIKEFFMMKGKLYIFFFLRKNDRDYLFLNKLFSYKNYLRINNLFICGSLVNSTGFLQK